MKSFIALCFRRPVSVAAFFVLTVAMAAVAYERLPVALLPGLRYPALAVWTAYPDVPPGRVERAVTERIEEAVAGAEGLQEITARSQLGGSLVELRFGWNTDLDLALLGVREALARLGEALPEAAERPVVLRTDPSERPIMAIALRAAAPEAATGPASVPASAVQPAAQQEPAPQETPPGETSPEVLIQLKETGREVVARRLEQLPGVARVRVTGGYDRQIEVRLDPGRMNRYGLSIEEVSAALRRANVALPGGLIRRGPFRYAVEVSGEFAAPEDVAQAVVARRGGAALRLADVADVRGGVEERRGLVRLDGRETLLLLVERTPDANTVRTAEEVRAALGELQAELPGVRLGAVLDESRFIEAAIGSVTQAVLLGGLLAVVILFVFLRRPKALAAVALAVPLSLGITLILFEALGVSFNLISLSGLALGVGMLVDNAIVVVENVARLREDGRPPRKAALLGAQQVAGAITASTLTTIAVFLPLTFVEGLAGRLFRDQSLAVVASLLASLLVALTAVPLVAAWDRSSATEKARGLQAPRLLALYERGLRWSLGHRGPVVALCAALLAGAALLAWQLPREVVPAADQGRVEAHLRLPPDAGLPLVSARAAALEDEVLQRGLAEAVLSDLGERDEARLTLNPRLPYEGDLTLLLPGAASAGEVAARVRQLELPGDVEIDVRPAQTQLEALLSSGAADLFVDLIGDDRQAAQQASGALLEALRARPELTGVRRADADEVPAYRMTLNRENLARFGVDAQTIAATLEAAARGRRATALQAVGEEIPIVLRTTGATSIEDLLAAQVPTPSGGLLPLRRFARAEAVQLPAALVRAGQAPVVRLVADVAPGGGLAGAERAIRAAFAEVLPPGVRGQVRGASEAFQRSLRALGWSLALSVLLVYLILAAQFEHLAQPLTILAAVPLALAGVAFTLGAAGQTVNLMSLTGSVVLVGIVVNDAIIKVDRINQLRAEGLAVREAVVRAGRDRVRPILMTTITTALGLLPLALGLGAGAELRAPLAIAIIGGLACATGLTLFVVPVLYSLISGR